MFITALFLTNIARTYEKEGSYEILLLLTVVKGMLL